MFPAGYLFKEVSSDFEMILRCFVSGLKSPLARGQFFPGPQVAEQLPGTLFLRFSGLFGTRSGSRSKPLAAG